MNPAEAFAPRPRVEADDNSRPSSSGSRFAVHQPLVVRRPDREQGPLAIIQLAGVPAEIKLRNVPVQVFFADGMERAVQTALEQRKESFGAVRGDIATSVFFDAVIDRLV